ncbi:MAG TPA: hypothetical protein PKK10_12890 [Woeseiaceae bacterium]|nr:hypothetical protein [Woeseiaceae bacterium]
MPKLNQASRQACLLLVTTLSMVCFAHSASAQTGGSFYGSRGDSATLNTQQKVEALYEQGDYERAFFIYQSELAPVGDKYAQYMVGFMYLTGTGVDEDAVLASAWYRLAAERSYPEFVTIRDQLLAGFDEPELLRSDTLYRELRRKYSDLAILMRLLKEDIAATHVQTGSRLSNSSAPVSILDPHTGDSLTSDHYARQFRKQAEEHLKLLSAILADRNIDTDVDKINLKELQAIVDEEVEKIDDRNDKRNETAELAIER